MSETPIAMRDIASLSALANGIIPADARDAGAASVHAGPGIAERMRWSPFGQVYVDGLKAAQDLSRAMFDLTVQDLDAPRMHALIAKLSDEAPAFFRMLRADVCALYLSDPAVWQRIGFPGPSAERGGYPDFDQPQI